MTTPRSKADSLTSFAGEAVRGKVVVVTGSSSGLGLETAKQLAVQGAEVVMICRDQNRGERARSQVADAATGKPPVLMLADLSIQADVRRVATEVKEHYDSVDTLINNAGSAFNIREQSADGFERTWATNHLAPFLLTHLLLSALEAAPAGRIVSVTSEIYSRKLDLDDIQGERKYSYLDAYRRSKLANVLFTAELARRIEGAGVTAVAVSPGAARTSFGGGGPSGVMGVVTGVLKRTPVFQPADRAAEGIVWAATAPEPEESPGALYMRRKRLAPKGAAKDPALAAKVWTISEEQTGIDPRRSAVAGVSSKSRGSHR